VRCSTSQTDLQNIHYQGENTFRLNNAMNLNSGQDYTFTTSLGPANFANLEMINGTTTYQGGNITIGSGGTLHVSNTTGSITDALDSGGTMTVDSDATLAVGTWSVTGGTATINGTVTTDNAVNVSGGGILKGAGTITAGTEGDATWDVIIASDGFVNAGNSPGTLTINGDFDVAGTLQVEVTDLVGFAIDLYSVTGNVDITGATLEMINLGGGAYDRTVPHTIVEYGGNLTGTFASAIGTPNAYNIVYGVDLGGGLFGIQVYIPEPASAALLLLGAAAMLHRRRR
jgi:hypothetical protein